MRLTLCRDVRWTFVVDVWSGKKYGECDPHNGYRQSRRRIRDGISDHFSLLELETDKQQSDINIFFSGDSKAIRTSSTRWYLESLSLTRRQSVVSQSRFTRLSLTSIDARLSHTTTIYDINFDGSLEGRRWSNKQFWIFIFICCSQFWLLYENWKRDNNSTRFKSTCDFASLGAAAVFTRLSRVFLYANFMFISSIVYYVDLSEASFENLISHNSSF